MASPAPGTRLHLPATPVLLRRRYRVRLHLGRLRPLHERHGRRLTRGACSTGQEGSAKDHAGEEGGLRRGEEDVYGAEVCEKQYRSGRNAEGSQVRIVLLT